MPSCYCNGLHTLQRLTWQRYYATAAVGNGLAPCHLVQQPAVHGADTHVAPAQAKHYVYCLLQAELLLGVMGPMANCECQQAAAMPG
jgi:hypothetical protein